MEQPQSPISRRELSVGGVISDGWRLTSGVKTTFLLATLLNFVLVFFLLLAAGLLLPAEEPGVLHLIVQLIVTGVSTVLWIGLMIMGIRYVRGERIAVGMVLEHFSKILPVLATVILSSILIVIGFLLFIIPGIYLSLAYSMALPLVVEKGLGPWQALEASRKATTPHWFTIFGIFFIFGIIAFLSAIPLGIGLIWTIPMAYIVWALVYCHLFDRGAV